MNSSTLATGPELRDIHKSGKNCKSSTSLRELQMHIALRQITVKILTGRCLRSFPGNRGYGREESIGSRRQDVTRS